MKKVKKAVNYWCEDTIGQRFLGQGVGVAVLDTGISLHPDFDRRICCFQDRVHGKHMVYDDNGHGSHVAGVIGGSGLLSKGIYSGIAPLCRLIIIKVLDEKGDGTIGKLIGGIRWVLQNYKNYNIRIVNISVGTLPHEGNKGEAQLLKDVERLWDAGLIVIAAAGNYGPKAGTVTTPGTSRKIITVGSSNDQEESDTFGKRKNYSGRGPTKECVVKPDLLAPGSGVVSCNGKYRGTGEPYVRKSGTSMATPVVSGAVALLLSKYPSMRNVEVKLKLRESCTDLGEDKNRQGWGLLNVGKLMAG